MQYNPGEFEEILNIFKAESDEIIQALNDNFLTLEKNPDDKTPLKKLLQLSHSLKGAARMLGFNDIQNLAHKLEDILSFWNKQNIHINKSAFQPVYETCDFLLVLVAKSVELKANYVHPKTDDYMNLLNSLLNTEENDVPAEDNKTVPETKSEIPVNTDPAELLDEQQSHEFVQKYNIDIDAAVLELIFVIAKNDEDDIEDVVSLIDENLNILYEIFKLTIFDDVKNLINLLRKHSKSNNPDMEIFVKNIPLLRDAVYNVFKSLNIDNDSNGKRRKPPVQDTEETPKIDPPAPDEPDIEDNINTGFDKILSNIQMLRQNIDYIGEVSDFLHEILNNTQDENLISVLTKTVKILDLFKSANITLDKDCYLVMLQCIYLIKRMYSNSDDTGLDNIEFLMQRLNVVEDMFNILNNSSTVAPEINTTPEVPTIKDIGILPKNSDAKNKLNTFDLQEIKTLRVDTQKLDNLIAQTGELLINGIKTREHISELHKIISKVIKLNAESKKVLNYLRYLEKRGFFSQITDESFLMFHKKVQGFFYENSDITNEINNDLAILYNTMSTDDNKLHQNAVETDVLAKSIRVLPLATIFHSFPRMIRDISKEYDKSVEFFISGSDTSVDKKILEEIKMPLIHILRNAVSHGIGSPEERVALGKNPSGMIKLSARQSENNVIITVEDDGCGIDLNRVKETAVEKGLLLRDEADNLNEQQIIKLLFLPGFSTQTAVNEISGRGVGLDVVKSKITNLNGEILIESALHQGCKITLKLPLSLSTLKVFIVLVNKQKYAIPVSNIKYVKHIKPEEIYNKNTKSCIMYNSHSVQLFYLSSILSDNPSEFKAEQSYDNKNRLTVVLIENKGKEAAFVVDELLSDAEVFRKKLVAPIIKIKNISGFTTLGNGEICLILNTIELIKNVITEERVQPLVSGLLPDDII